MTTLRKLQVREITFGSDDDLGPVISSIQIGRTWAMDPTSLLEMVIFNGSANETVDATGFSFSDPETVDDVTTIVATYNEDADLVITLKATKTERGFRFNLSWPSGHQTKIVKVGWPRFEIKPPGDPTQTFSMFGARGGHCIFQPHIGDGVLYSTEVPGGLPVGAYWDIETKAIFYMMCDDEDSNLIQLDSEGTGTATRFVWFHFMDRRYTAGQGYSKTYSIYVESFTGLSLDGVLCCDDVNARLAEWIADGKRPWITVPWKDRVDVPDRIKDANVYWVQARGERDDYSVIAEDLVNLRSHLISGGVPLDSMLTTYYAWPNDGVNYLNRVPDVFDLPPEVLDAELILTVDTLQALDIHVTLYTMPRWAISGLEGSDFDPASFEVSITDPFSGAVGTTVYDVRDYAMKDRNGALKSSVWSGVGDLVPLFPFDFTHIEVRSILFEVYERYMDGFTGTTMPHGLYIDTHPGEITNLENQDLPARTDWTYSDYYRGTRDTVAFLKLALRRTFDQSLQFSMENPDVAMIPIVDMMYFPRLPGLDLGVPTRSQHYTLGRYIRIGDYAQPSVFAVFELFNKALYPLIQAMTIEFLNSGFITIVSRSDGSLGTIVELPINGSHVLDPLWDWMKVLHESKPHLLKYFQGRHLRDAGGNSNAFRIAMMKQREFNDVFWMLWYGGGFHTQSCVRKADDGDVGVIIFNTYKTGIFLPWHIVPSSPAQSVTVTLDSTVHELPPGTKKLYVVNLATGARTLLTTFTHSVTIERTISPASVELLEISVT